MKKKTTARKKPLPLPVDMPDGVTREDVTLDPLTLIPYINNARKHTEEQVLEIAASIREWGFTNPILIDENNEMIAGHGRQRAAIKLQLTAVPCVRLVGLNKTQKRALILADNRIAENASWDEDLLKLELADLNLGNFDLSLIGFEQSELDRLLAPEETGGETDDDAVGDAPVAPVSRDGDVWILGEHRLVCGDVRDAAAIEALMAGRLADMLLTDPPYNVDYVGKTADALKISNDKMSDTEFREFLRAGNASADSVMKPGAVFYIWHNDIEGYNFRGACRDVDWQVRQCLIWKKNHMVMGRQDYHWKHESCLYGWKGGAGHLWATDRKQTTILEFDRPQASEKHPTMKPVALFQYQIENNTRGHDIVLDPFAGSGTTMIACEKVSRSARCMDTDPRYVDVMIDRWQDFTGNEAVLEETGQTFSSVRHEREAS